MPRDDGADVRHGTRSGYGTIDAKVSPFECSRLRSPDSSSSSSSDSEEGPDCEDEDDSSASSGSALELPTRATATVAEAKRLARSYRTPRDWLASEFDMSTALRGPAPHCSPPAAVSAQHAARECTRLDATAPLLIAGPAPFDPSAWTPAALSESCGDAPLFLTARDGAGARISVPCAAYVDYLADCPDRAGPTVFDARVLDPRECLHLSSLYVPPVVPALGLGAAAGRLLERLDPGSRPDTRWLLLGPARSGSAPHRNPAGTGAWNTVCDGTKRWAVFSPDVAPALAERGVGDDGDAAAWFREEWPRVAAEVVTAGGAALDFLQRAGETVYVPPGWWHAVLNVEPSVAITENFVSADMLQATVDRAVAASDAAHGRDVAAALCARKEVADAVVKMLDLVDGRGGRVWQWLAGCHEDALIVLPAACRAMSCQAIVSSLRNPGAEPIACAEAVRIFYDGGGGDEREQLLDAGVLTPLCALLPRRGDDASVRAVVARALWSLAASPGARDDIRGHPAGILSALVAMLRSPYDAGADTHEAAACALRRLAISESNEDAIREAGAVPVLVGLASRADVGAGTREAACFTLQNLASEANAANQAAVREAGGLETLAALAANATAAASTRQAATGVLWNLRTDSTNKALLDEIQARSSCVGGRRTILPKNWDPRVVFIGTLLGEGDFSDSAQRAIALALHAAPEPCASVRIRRIKTSTHPCFRQRGLFATAALGPGARPLRYTGVVKRRAAADPSEYLFAFRRLDGLGGCDVDAARAGNESRFINDCAGTGRRNAQFVESRSEGGAAEVWVEALRPIAAGEEILVSYGSSFWGGDDKIDLQSPVSDA